MFYGPDRGLVHLSCLIVFVQISRDGNAYAQHGSEGHDGSTTKPVDFCTQHSLADFRVYFNGFRWESMEMKEKLDTFAPFDVCRSPSLRLNTMIPSILQRRLNRLDMQPPTLEETTS